MHQCDRCIWVMSLVVRGMVMCTSVMAADCVLQLLHMGCPQVP